MIAGRRRQFKRAEALRFYAIRAVVAYRFNKPAVHKEVQSLQVVRAGVPDVNLVAARADYPEAFLDAAYLHSRALPGLVLHVFLQPAYEDEGKAHYRYRYKKQKYDCNHGGDAFHDPIWRGVYKTLRHKNFV